MSGKTKQRRRIDYRSQYWGHVADLVRTGTLHKSGAPLFRGHCFGPHVTKGDEIVLAMGSGRDAVFRLTEVHTPPDPGDMHMITAYPHHYLDEEAK